MLLIVFVRFDCHRLSQLLHPSVKEAPRVTRFHSCSQQEGGLGLFNKKGGIEMKGTVWSVFLSFTRFFLPVSSLLCDHWDKGFAVVAHHVNQAGDLFQMI